MAKKKPNRYETDAALEAALRFSPQESALASLLAGERSNRITTIKSAEGGARAATASVKAARSPLRHAYEQAGITRQDANSESDAVLARLGSGADLFKAGIARERANAKTRIGESQASALGGLEDRLQQIALGAQAARGAADQRYASSKSQIGQQFVDLGREKGLFTALSVSRQKEAQRQRNADWKKVAAQIESQGALQEDQQSFTAGENQKDRDAEAKKPKKPKGLTADQKDKRVSAVGKARSYVRQLRASDRGLKRSDIAPALLGGRKIKDKDGDVVLDIKPVGELWASVALDLEFDGHVSRANRQRLKRQGVSATGSGWNIKATPKPKRAAPRRPGGISGSSRGSAAAAVRRGVRPVR